MTNIKRDISSFDITLLVLTLVLAAFGLLMVGSATGLGSGNVSGAFINQLIFLITGIVIMLAAAFFDYQTICKFYLPIYGVNILFLIIVLFMPKTAGVARWIGVTIGDTRFGIQPSEFAKIFMIIFLAALINKYKDKINHPLIAGMVVAATALPAILIFVQPSYSASIVVPIIMLVMLYASKISYKYIIIPAVILVPLLLFLFIELHSENPLILNDILEPWQIDRIWQFLYSEGADIDTWQNDQALMALSSGLLTGRGLFNNQIYVPYIENDFIFSIIGAEFGFLGSLAVLAVFFLIVLKCFIIAYRSQVFLGKLLAVGAGATIALQTFLHVGVNTFILPNTGINLPFISQGGSAMWVFMGMVGLVLNVGMTREYSMFDTLGTKPRRLHIPIKPK